MLEIGTLPFSQGDEKPFLLSYPFSDKLSHWIKFPKINFVPVFFLCKSYTYFNLWIFVLFRSGQLFSQGERNLRISGPRVRERSPRKIVCLQGRGWESFLIIFARGCQRVCLSVSLFASKRLILMSWLKIRV